RPDRAGRNMRATRAMCVVSVKREVCYPVCFFSWSWCAPSWAISGTMRCALILRVMSRYRGTERRLVTARRTSSSSEHKNSMQRHGEARDVRRPAFPGCDYLTIRRARMSIEERLWRTEHNRAMMMMTMVLIALALLGLFNRTGLCASPSREEEIATKGAKVMPFDLEQTMHMFQP